MRPAHVSALLLFLTVLVGGCLLLQPPAPAPAGVTGQVTDAGGPVAGARVKYQGECPAVLTDRTGRFHLPAPSGKARRVTAWKQGHSIAAAPLGPGPLRLTLTPLPDHDSDDYTWVDPRPDPASPRNCANCHAAIYAEWAASGHARGASNRRFLNLFDGTDWHGRPTHGWSLLAQRPEGAGVCAACHAPTFTDPTFDYDFRRVRGVPALGVHCDYCHKVADAPTDRLGTRFGRDGLRLLRPADGRQLFFGPLDDAHRAGEEFGYAPFYKESRYCAACHEGVVFGVHAYGTYSEWLESPARRQGRQCQDCHMAPTGKLTNVAPGKGGIDRDPRTLASHRFPGGRGDLLRSCLAVEATAGRTKGGVVLRVEVRAEGVGHRVPTGFADRNLVLVVEAEDAAGRPVRLRDGPTLPAAAGKRYAGLAGLLYAKLLRVPRGERPAPFWAEQAEEEHDSRLTPGRPDGSAYRFPAEAARLRVRLLYRRFWPHVAAERGWPDNETVVSERTLGVGPAGREAKPLEPRQRRR
jgi:hypothetical protein